MGQLDQTAHASDSCERRVMLLALRLAFEYPRHLELMTLREGGNTSLLSFWFYIVGFKSGWVAAGGEERFVTNRAGAKMIAQRQHRLNRRRRNAARKRRVKR